MKLSRSGEGTQSPAGKKASLTVEWDGSVPMIEAHGAMETDGSSPASA